MTNVYRFRKATKRLDYRSNKKIKCEIGHAHRSGWECTLCNDIRSRGNAELIKYEPSVYLTISRILFKPDFLIFDQTLKEEVYEEMKGKRTQMYAMKERLWRDGYGPVCSRTGRKCILRVYTVDKLGRPRITKTVVPQH